MTLSFEPLENTTSAFFHDIFYASLFTPPGEPPPPRAIINSPELRRYYQYWGREGDLGFVIKDGEEPIGAIWSRKFSAEEPGYGFVAEDIPEFGIAIVKGRRGQRIGQRLLLHFFDALRERGDERVSLSVHGDNHAAEWYRRLGFRIHSFDGKHLRMVLDL